MNKIDTWKEWRIVKLLLQLARIRFLRFILPLAVLGLVYWEAQHELKTFDLASLISLLQQLPLNGILQLAGFSLIAVAAMSGYDYLIRHHFKLKVGKFAAFRYSWIANTCNNVFGFAGVTGAGLRTLLYRGSGISPIQMASAVVFLSPIVIVGLSVLSWGCITGLFYMSNLLEAHTWLRVALWGMALYLPVFLLIQRSKQYSKWFNRSKGQLPWSTILASIVASLLEWVFAGLTFWLISHYILQNVSFQDAMGIYIVAAIAGLISMAPGGIGTFDLIAILGLELLQTEPENALAVLVLFRLFYFFIPWLIGLLLCAVEFVPQRKREQALSGSRRTTKSPS